jgi:hypothetical protein
VKRANEFDYQDFRDMPLCVSLCTTVLLWLSQECTVLQTLVQHVMALLLIISLAGNCCYLHNCSNIHELILLLLAPLLSSAIVASECYASAIAISTAVKAQANSHCTVTSVRNHNHGVINSAT